MTVSEVSSSGSMALHIDATAASSTAKAPYPIQRDWLQQVIAQHNTNTSKSEKALALAPMVDQSDLPFRLLCRRYNCNVCFTPMIHVKLFYQLESYRNKFWPATGTLSQDRPLIVQLCGSDVKHLSYTINYILTHAGSGIDGIDLNCGCPQTIAKRGNYGAFLLEQGDDALVKVVSALVQTFGHQIPISVKVRLLPSGLEPSLQLYTQLVESGIAMLTVHGRNRHQKGLQTGRADWDAIATVVKILGTKIPILANGSIGNMDDVRDCLKLTGADGIMSSEAILEYPPLFTETGTAAVQNKRTGPGRLECAHNYLQLAQEYPPQLGGQGNGIKCIRAHLHRMLHYDLKEQPLLRDSIAYAKDISVLHNTLATISQLQDTAGHLIENESLSWYMRHRVASDGPLASARLLMDRQVQYTELDDDAAGCFATLYGTTDE